MNRNVVLTNGTISLRPYTMEDAQNLYEAARESIPEMYPWMPWCHANYALEESRDWLATRAPSWEHRTEFDFTIVDSTDDTFLGGCGLNRFDLENKFCSLGYWVRTGRTKHGVATA